MKVHTTAFKEQIKEMGRELDSIITYGDTVLGNEQLNAVTPSYQGAILKSVMKQLDIDSNVEIPLGTIIRYQFGLKVNGQYEYIDFGNYIVYKSEKQEDTNSYRITCYDKLLYSMLDYVKLPITYPISIRDYINSISTVLGLQFANKNTVFANYNKQIKSDLYDGLGYTFRDVLDELAQVTASTICLNKNDELEIRYITETNDVIDEEYLKDVNVNFGEKFGAVNTIVLSRSADSDNIYYPTTLPEKPYEIKISDNQIMNDNDRADFLPDIYNKLNGLEFYTNDFVSTGICYYDLCDRYSVKIGNKVYSCVMFNDEVLVTQGLSENIYTDLPAQTETDYKKSDTDDRRINQAYLILNKQEKTLEGVLSEQSAQGEQIAKIEADTSSIELSVEETKGAVDALNPIAETEGTDLTLENSAGLNTVDFRIDGNYHQETEPSPDYPSEVEVVEGYNLFDEKTLINGYFGNEQFVIVSANNYRTIEATLNKGTYTLSFEDNDIYLIRQYVDGVISAITKTTSSYTFTTNNGGTVGFAFRKTDSSEITVNPKITLSKGSVKKTHLPYQNIGIKNVGQNLLGLIDGTYTHNGITAVVDNGKITLNGTATNTSFIEVPLVNNINLENQTITISVNNSTTGGDSLTEFRVYTNGSVYMPCTFTTINNSVTYTMRTGVYERTQIRTSSGVTYNNFVIYPQLKLGETATEYEEYKGTITPLDLKGEFIGKLPNGAQDYLTVDNQGNYGIQKYVGRRILNGSEGLTAQGNYCCATVIAGMKPSGSYATTTPVTAMSDYYAGRSWYYLNKEQNNAIDCVAVHNSTNKLFIRNKAIGADIEALKTSLSQNPVTVYYELAEPYFVPLGQTPIKTLEGYSTMQLLSTLDTNMYCKYIRFVDSLDAFQTKEGMGNYYNKFETDAQISIQKDEILSEVSDVRTLVDDTGKALAGLEQSVSERITSTEAQISVVNNKLENGVEKLKNTLVTIDIEGIKVSTNTSKISSLTANDKFVIKDGSDRNLIFIGYDEVEGKSKAEMDNLYVSNYFTAGYHRQEKMKGLNRTGWFYVGGSE